MHFLAGLSLAIEPVCHWEAETIERSIAPDVVILTQSFGRGGLGRQRVGEMKLCCMKRNPMK